MNYQSVAILFINQLVLFQIQYRIATIKNCQRTDIMDGARESAAARSTIGTHRCLLLWRITLRYDYFALVFFVWFEYDFRFLEIVSRRRPWQGLNVKTKSKATTKFYFISTHHFFF